MFIFKQRIEKVLPFLSWKVTYKYKSVALPTMEGYL